MENAVIVASKINEVEEIKLRFRAIRKDGNVFTLVTDIEYVTDDMLNNVFDWYEIIPVMDSNQVTVRLTTPVGMIREVNKIIGVVTIIHR